ncbi:MAG: hypothetical protein HZB29_12665 [Nitrospinae bacterium]|nr:hypothetical protein [Nitrospinota bacterium]
MSISKKTSILALLSIFIIAPAAFAQSDGSSSYGEQFTFEIRGLYWNSSLQNIVRADSGSLKGTDIDLVSDLGLDNNKGLPFGQVEIKFAERHKLIADYISFSYTGNKVVSENLVFNGVSYPVASRVQTALDLKSARIGYEYDLVRDPLGYLAFRLAANYVYAKAQVVTAGALSNSISMDAWAPVVGISARLTPVSMVSISAEVAGVGFEKSSVLDSSIYLDVNPIPNVGLTAGWRNIRIVVDVDGKKADTQWSGPFGGVAVRF